MSYKEAIAKFDHPMVLAFGNPLLDIIIENDEYNICKSFNLPIDEQTEMDENEIQELLNLVPSKSLQNTNAGGSALNTLRILQKLAVKKDGNKIGIFFGGIGLDRRATDLKKLIRDANVDAKFAINFDLKSGVCIAVINGENRCLVANLGAAAYYSIEDFNCVIVPWDSARILYIEGFFITHSFDTAKEVIKQSQLQGKNIIIAFNLSATYIFKNHHLQVCQMVGMSKIIFGNIHEMIALAKAIPLVYEDPAEIPFALNKLQAVSMSASSSTSNDWLQSNIIVMTQGGKKPAIVVWGNGESAQVSPISLKEPLIDTTGAGDALVAGFFAGVLSGKDPATCLKWGVKAASHVVTRLGVTVSDDLSDDFLENS